MAKKIRLLGAVGPEPDCKGQGTHCLAVAVDEGAAEINAFEAVFFGLEGGDLADVVAGRECESGRGG